MSYQLKRPKSASSGRASPQPNAYAFTGSTTAAHGGPKQLKDAEELTNEVALHKKRYSAVAQENVYLRTAVQRLTAQLRKKEKQMQQIIDLKVDGLNQKAAAAAAAGGGSAGSGMSDTALAGKLHDLRKDLVTIHRLSEQNRALEQVNAEQSEELKLLKSSLKFTLIKELQIEAETYYHEARRLKQIIDRNGLGAGGSGSAGANGSPRQLKSGAQSARQLGSTGSSNGIGGSRPGSAKGSAANAGDQKAAAAAALPAGVERELEQLREENRRLRMENGYLNSEREEKEKGMAVLASFQKKMAGLATQLNEAQLLLAKPQDANAAAAALAVDRPGSAGAKPAKRK